MAVNQQPTCFYTADGNNNLVIHNGDHTALGGKYSGRSGSAVNDQGIPSSAISGNGKLTYTGALGTFSGVQLKSQHLN